jgi:hypothetical protein
MNNNNQVLLLYKRTNKGRKERKQHIYKRTNKQSGNTRVKKKKETNKPKPSRKYQTESITSSTTSRNMVSVVTKTMVDYIKEYDNAFWGKLTAY